MLQLSVHSEAQRTEWLWIVQGADRSGKYIYIYIYMEFIYIYIYMYIYIYIDMERDNPSESNPMTMAFLSSNVPAGTIWNLKNNISEQ